MSLFHQATPKPPSDQTDFRIDLPGVIIAFNHPLRVAFLYEYDSSMPADRYNELESYLKKQGWFLQVVVSAPGVPMAVPQPFASE